MSDKKDKDAKPKKGKGMLVKAVLAVVLIGAGGGGTFALVQAGVIGHKDARKEDNSPKLVKKGDTDPFAPKAEAKDGAGPAEVEGDGGSAYKTSYYNFSEEFTSNLKNSTALVQLSLACSTHRDGRVLMWLKKHELAIRSEILIVLADTPEEDIATPDGKARLQKRLAAAINTVLTRAEGFGGVDEVYFKSFLVQ